MTDFIPGTKVEVTLPFAKRPFKAVISDEICPLKNCYQIIVDKPTRATLSTKIANVDKSACRAI